MDASAFFSNVGGCRDGMKMERQEKYRQEQQQANQTYMPGSAGSWRNCRHQALNMKLYVFCQTYVRISQDSLNKNTYPTEQKRNLLTEKGLRLASFIWGQNNGARFTTYPNSRYLFASLYLHCLRLLRVKLHAHELCVRCDGSF
jgi:hypothetical protein